jgi:hypothetical protein
MQSAWVCIFTSTGRLLSVKSIHRNRRFSSNSLNISEGIFFDVLYFEKYTFFKKRLYILMIRACARAKNLHVSKKNINFARFFDGWNYKNVCKYLKIVHFANRT